jgi:hypothetical protein
VGLIHENIMEQEIGTVSVIYIQDIEGNIIELQNWK